MMDKQFVKEGNKLLADFIYSPDKSNTGDDDDFWHYSGGVHYHENLCFHKDWNELMYVIEKIEHLIEVEQPKPICSKKNAFFFISIPQILFEDCSGETVMMMSRFSSSRKERCFDVCVQFVKWLKENS